MKWRRLFGFTYGDVNGTGCLHLHTEIDKLAYIYDPIHNKNSWRIFV